MRSLILPIKWSHDQLKCWLQKSCSGMFRDLKIVKSDTGKTIMAQTIPKLASGICKGNTVLATNLYNKLRGESDRCHKVLLQERQMRKKMLKGLD